MAMSGLDNFTMALPGFETIIQNIAKENNLKQSLIRQKRLQLDELQREVTEKEERIRKTELVIKTQVEMNIQVKSIVTMRQANICRLEQHYKLLEEHEASLRRQLAVKRMESKRRVYSLQSLLNRNRDLCDKNNLKYQSNPLLLQLQKLEQSTNIVRSASNEVDYDKGSAKPSIVHFDVHVQLDDPVDESIDLKSTKSEADDFEQPDVSSHTVSSTEDVLNTSAYKDLKELTDATQQLTTKSSVAMETAESSVTLETTKSNAVMETVADVTDLDEPHDAVLQQAAMSSQSNESQTTPSKQQHEEITSTLQQKHLANQNNHKSEAAITRKEDVIWKKPTHNTKMLWEATSDSRERTNSNPTVIRETPLMASTPFTVTHSNKLKTAVEERNGKTKACSLNQQVSHLQTKPHSITSSRQASFEKSETDTDGAMNFFTDEEVNDAKQSDNENDFAQFLQNVRNSPAAEQKNDNYDFFNHSYTYNADDVGDASYQGNFFDDSEPGPSRKTQDSEQFDFFNHSPDDGETLLF